MTRLSEIRCHALKISKQCRLAKRKSMKENMKGFQRYFLYESGLYRNFTEMMWWPLKKAPSRSSPLLFFFLLLFVGAFVSTSLIDSTIIESNQTQKSILATKKPPMYPPNPHKIPKNPLNKIEIPLNCTALTQTCPSNYPTTFLPEDHDRSSSPHCPDYFRWIYEDLRPWKVTGITRDIVESAKRTANFKLVIVKGRAYIERHHKAFQTRDVFTLWGILQLLRRYPGSVPDLELMFDCNDTPVIRSWDSRGPNATLPPPLFRYSGDDATLDIVFPDWSFWGWPEVNIKPWESLLKDLKEGNTRTRWIEREPYAYWKGYPRVTATGLDLLKCNVSEKQDWNARVYSQNWRQESRQRFKQSDLASQCIHRFRIYMEGIALSVSEKYILACDSVTLIVKSHFYDFFTRSLIPLHHFWPIMDDDKCRSIKFAVDWGNTNKQKAQAIGKAASNFIEEDLKMDNVYDYMFHLLNEYAKLLRFKPTVPQNAIELCSETMACPVEGLKKKFMMESMVMGPTDTSPCTMPSPYDPRALRAFLRKKRNSIKRVKIWQKKYWKNKSK